MEDGGDVRALHLVRRPRERRRRRLPSQVEGKPLILEPVLDDGLVRVPHDRVAEAGQQE